MQYNDALNMEIESLQSFLDDSSVKLEYGIYNTIQELMMTSEISVGQFSACVDLLKRLNELNYDVNPDTLKALCAAIMTISERQITCLFDFEQEQIDETKKLLSSLKFQIFGPEYIEEAAGKGAYVQFIEIAKGDWYQSLRKKRSNEHLLLERKKQ